MKEQHYLSFLFTEKILDVLLTIFTILADSSILFFNLL